jgi:hypothetical protein
MLSSIHGQTANPEAESHSIQSSTWTTTLALPRTIKNGLNRGRKKNDTNNTNDFLFKKRRERKPKVLRKKKTHKEKKQQKWFADSRVF